MLYIRDLIRKKRNHQELTEEETMFFINSYNKDEILREQAASLLTLMYTNGLEEKEMAYLSQAMAKTGAISEIYKISNQIVDIHPIGGMDDKIIILMLLILNTLNFPAFKVISREVGFADKLPNIPIRNLERDNIKELLESGEIVFAQEAENTAPVENKLYKLRNDIACNDDISLISLSIMSQKIALGARNIIFDISYGEKAYVKTEKEAQRLAKYLIQMGNKLDRKVKCLVTKLDEPVGNTFGNTIELQELINITKDNMPEDVKELVLEMGSNMLALIDERSNVRQNKKVIEDLIENGDLNHTLMKLINENGIRLEKAKVTVPVMANESGYVEKVDISQIRTNAQYLNAIRHKKEDKLDLGAGIEICKKIGDKVEVGEIIGYIYTNDETKVQMAVQKLKEAYVMSNSRVKRKSRISEIL